MDTVVDKPLNIARSYTIAFSPDASKLATVARYVGIWDLRLRRKTVRVHPVSHPSDLAFSPDGSLLAVKSTSGRIAIVDSCTGDLEGDFGNMNDGEGSNLVFSACGRFIIDGAWSGNLQVREIPTGRVVHSVSLPHEQVSRVQYCRATDQIYILRRRKSIGGATIVEPDYLSVFVLTTGRFQDPCIRLPQLWTFEVSRSGKHVAVIHGNARLTLSVIHISNGALVAQMPLESSGCGSSLAWRLDDGAIAAVGRHSVVLASFPDLLTRNLIEVPFASDVAFSPDGASLAIGSWEAGSVIRLAG